MRLPKPDPGLVVAYDYLWRYEVRLGRDAGQKTRPCAIVVSVTDESGDIVVMVSPITHAHPKDPDIAIPLPPKVKRHLGLDDQPSWIIADEINRFVWPGPDLRPVSSKSNDKFEYGMLPVDIFDRLRRRILALNKERRLRVVTRSE